MKKLANPRLRESSEILLKSSPLPGVSSPKSAISCRSIASRSTTNRTTLTSCPWIFLPPDGRHFQGDTVNNAGFALIKSFQYDCPTFYLERELGELLLRTEIPVDFSSDDMRWRWPSMRIFLPKGLICVEREGKQRNMMYVDVGYTEGSEEIWPPQDCTDEIVRVFNRTTAVKFSDSSSMWKTKDTTLSIDQEDDLLMGRLN